MHRLLPLLLLCLALLAATTAHAQYDIFPKCESNTNYTLGSAFQANLEAALSSLPSAAAASWGFAKNFTGAAPDQAFTLAQCRRDVSASQCRKCVDDLAQRLFKDCQGQKSAVIVSAFCMVRHSNESFFGVSDSTLVTSYNSAVNAKELEVFRARVLALMKGLIGKAAYQSPRLYAAGSVEDLTPKVYGVAQCTGDLTNYGCYSCLDRAVVAIGDRWQNKDGCQIIFRSCFIRFESSLFYDPVAAEEAMSPGDGSSNNGSNRGLGTALLVSVPVAVTLLALLLFLAVCICKRMKLHEHVQLASNRHEDEEMGSSESLQYALSTLIAATDNFSEQNKLGQGSFGPVYRGKLQNGQEIAVKRLSATSQQGQAEMKNEVALVAKLQHKNLVRLLGYCIEKTESLLVYEFLSNKSLDKILYGPGRQWELSWELRYKIIVGIARGLMYLHEDSRLTIIHRDLKPGNILLDVDMNPKISDFGLAKLFHMDLSVANTCHVAGTRGYMAPEYLLNGIFSAKSDVFSYGVLLLEVVTGRRPSEDLLKYVWRHGSQGTVQPLLKSCPTDEPGQQQMLRCIHIGLLCVQDEPELRPRMAAVVLMLNSHSMTLAEPTEPVFAVTSESTGGSGSGTVHQ